MKNNEIIKKQILYRSTHRGTKEMDLLLGSFVKKYINEFNYEELLELEIFLKNEDDDIYKWYFEKKISTTIPDTKISILLKDHKV